MNHAELTQGTDYNRRSQSIQNLVWAYLLLKWPQIKFLSSVPRATFHCPSLRGLFRVNILILSNELQKGNVRNVLKIESIHWGHFAEVARREAAQTG